MAQHERMMIDRISRSAVSVALEHFPVAAILGPRQCGKTTLAKQLLDGYGKSIYLDLELESDRRKLDEPEFYLKQNEDRLVCLDEIQRMPDLFPLLRALIDQKRVPGRFLILGSASQDLLRQSTETLAGRIALYELSPLILGEVEHCNQIRHWIRGGYPDSFLAAEDDISFLWRENFIRTFLERDLGVMGFNLSSTQLRRLWTMLAHLHSGILNRATLSHALEVTSKTVLYWIDILEKTFMVRVLKPHEANLKKRLVKSPKVYIRDSGILHALLEIEGFEELMANPKSGSSWEGYAIENILTSMPQWSPSYYRTSNGAEIDLILERKSRKVAVEFKLSNSARVERGTYQALKDLGLDCVHVVTPQGTGEKIRENVRAESIQTFLNYLKTTEDK